MSVTVDTIFDEALNLSEDSRVVLAERLIESVPADPSIVEEQMEVVRRGRLHGIDAGAVNPVFGDEALRRVREAVLVRSES